MVLSCRFWYGKSGIINIFLVFSCPHILLNNQNNKKDNESVKHWTDINYKIKNNPTPWYVERYLDPIIFTLILTNFSLRLIKGKKGCKNVYLLHCVDWVSWNYWPVHETDEITLYKKDLAGFKLQKSQAYFAVFISFPQADLKPFSWNMAWKYTQYIAWFDYRIIIHIKA